MAEIEVRHLSKVFDQKGGRTQALKDISLTVEPGDIFGFIGMSGAGKSTLVRCLNYLEVPTERGTDRGKGPWDAVGDTASGGAEEYRHDIPEF